MYLVSQILVITGVIIDLISKLLKNKKLILLFMFIASIFFVLSYLFLKNPLAATANGVALTRYIWYLYLNQKNKNFKHYILPIVLLNVLFIIAFIFFMQSALDIILIVSTLILSFGLALNNLNMVRFSLLVNAILWAFYNFIIGAYGSFGCNILNIVVVIYALVYYNYGYKFFKKGRKNMKTVVLASGNKHKIKEIQEMFSKNEKTKDYQVIPMSEVGFEDDIEETGTTFEENALIKARAINKYLNSKGLDYAVLADDSGLCVEALGGAPGVYSARYAVEHNNEANRAKLKKELLDKENRKAMFVTCLVYMKSDGSYISCFGRTEGEILKEEKGLLDFCYDPLFYSYDLKKSFGEATEDEKNSVSHRGRAVANLIENL